MHGWCTGRCRTRKRRSNDGEGERPAYVWVYGSVLSNPASVARRSADSGGATATSSATYAEVGSPARGTASIAEASAVLVSTPKVKYEIGRTAAALASAAHTISWLVYETRRRVLRKAGEQRKSA